MGSLELWLTLPPVAAAIGWFTNFLAVRMIFRPRRAFNVLGFKLQGILPKRKAEFAANIGATVSEHLVSAEDIKKLIEDPKVKAQLKTDIEARIDNFIEKKLGSSMFGAFLKGPFLESMKATLLEEVEAVMEKGVISIGTHLDDHLDLQSIVEEKILSFDMDKLEGIALAVARKELFAIEILGAILGFVVGVIQLLVIQFLT